MAPYRLTTVLLLALGCAGPAAPTSMRVWRRGASAVEPASARMLHWLGPPGAFEEAALTEDRASFGGPHPGVVRWVSANGRIVVVQHFLQRTPEPGRLGQTTADGSTLTLYDTLADQSDDWAAVVAADPRGRYVVMRRERTLVLFDSVDGTRGEFPAGPASTSEANPRPMVRQLAPGTASGLESTGPSTWETEPPLFVPQADFGCLLHGVTDSSSRTHARVGSRTIGELSTGALTRLDGRPVPLPTGCQAAKIVDGAPAVLVDCGGDTRLFWPSEGRSIAWSTPLKVVQGSRAVLGAHGRVYMALRIRLGEEVRLARLCLSDGRLEVGPPAGELAAMHPSGWVLAPGTEERGGTLALDIVRGRLLHTRVTGQLDGLVIVRGDHDVVVLAPELGTWAPVTHIPVATTPRGCSLFPTVQQGPELAQGPWHLQCPALLFEFTIGNFF